MENPTDTNGTARTTKSRSSAAKSVKSRPQKQAVSPSSAKLEPAAKRVTKLDHAIALMRRPDGATVEDLMAATAWQKHSVRGAISGAIKKKLKLTVTTEKTEGRGTLYRIAPEAE